MSSQKSLTNIQNLAKKVDLIQVKKELKRIQSTKCRLLKQKGRKDYEIELNKVLREESDWKEVRNLLESKPKPVTKYEQADVDKLDYDETIKALKSIQSKKTLSRWLTDKECDNDEYRSAVKIEKMLLEHKSKNKPVDETQVRKTEVQRIVDVLESSGNLEQTEIIRLLKELTETK